MKFIAIAGTWGPTEPWVTDPASTPIGHYWKACGLEPVLPPFYWNARLDWLRFFTNNWRNGARDLIKFVLELPWDDRNIIAYSHGGQLPILAASWGLPIRTLTTIGTPRRYDVGAEKAVKNIGYWQHIYDLDRDRTASLPRSLGQIGDFVFKRERRFLIAGVSNVGLPGIDHGGMLNDPADFHWWEEAGLIEGIKHGPLLFGSQPQ